MLYDPATALRALLSSTPDLISFFDREGRYRYVGEATAAAIGRTPDEMLGRTPAELGLSSENLVRFDEQRRHVMATGESVRDEATTVHRRGRVVLDYVIAPVIDGGETIGVVVVVRDITDRKRAEQAKDDFLATLSHELRTPLTAAFGWIKLLARSRDPELIESGMRAVEESLVTQIRLIDELLDVSRVAVGKMHVEKQPLDLGTVIESAVEMVRQAAEAKQIALRVHSDSVMTVLGDAARLRQVAWNLLSNAVKFTPPGGAIDVELRRDGASAVMVVRDTGEGIDPKFLPNVFDRFRQADSSTSRRHGGLGIGLAIVSSLVEAHGGTVHAASEGEGKGATFTVTLPMIDRTNRVHPAPVVERKTLDANLGGARVLVVDDDDASRQLMITTLEAAGAEVRDCNNAGEAYDTVAAWLPHIVITDLAMPSEDGYSLIRRIRENGHDVPAVAITAYARAEDEIRVRDAGFQRHIAKPFDPAHLIQTVRDLSR